MAQKKTNRQRHYVLIGYTGQGYPRYTGVFRDKAAAVECAERLIKVARIATYKTVRLPDAQALEAWCDNHDWKVSIDYNRDGEVIAELERYTERGVDFILTVQPFTAEEYRQAVNAIDPNEEVMNLWRGDASYRAAMGDFATAWNDINDLKQTLVKTTKTLNV